MTTLGRLLAVTALAMVLATGAVCPRPARAVDTAVLVISSIAGYVAFVVLGAWLVFREAPSSALLPADGTPGEPASGGGLRPGHRCPAPDGGIPVVCW